MQEQAARPLADMARDAVRKHHKNLFEGLGYSFLKTSEEAGRIELGCMRNQRQRVCLEPVVQHPFEDVYRSEAEEIAI